MGMFREVLKTTILEHDPPNHKIQIVDSGPCLYLQYNTKQYKF